MKQQKGVVLFFAIIVLLLLTIIGVSLAVNSSMSLQMSNAGSERLEVVNEINEQLQNRFLEIQGMDVDQIDALLPNPDIIRLPQQVGTARDCTNNNAFCCVIYEVSQTVEYGKFDIAHPPVAFGIEKPVRIKDGTNNTCS